MSLKTRVIDGVRTRDNRNHNPVACLSLQILSSVGWALPGIKKPANASIGVPGTETFSEESMGNLWRRWVGP